MTSKAGWKQIGDAGAWKNTTVGVGSKGLLYTVESSGKLYATSGRTGGWDEIGGGYNTQHLAFDGEHLYAIEADGSLYRVATESGEWTMIGKKGDWKGTTAAVAMKGNLYTVSDYTLYETNLADGEWVALGGDRDESDGWDTKFLFVDGESLYALENDGSIYQIGADGSAERLGEEGDWQGTRTVATLEGCLYSVEESGALYKTDLSDGTWEEHGTLEDFGSTALLFGTGKAVYSVDHDGNLYKLDL
jgi:hemin uptake protein HemP